MLKRKTKLTHLEISHVFWGGISADFLPVDHVVAFLVEVTHCASPVTLVESSIDLLSRETQARHHRVGWFKHVGDGEGRERR